MVNRRDSNDASEIMQFLSRRKGLRERTTTTRLRRIKSTSRKGNLTFCNEAQPRGASESEVEDEQANAVYNTPFEGVTVRSAVG